MTDTPDSPNNDLMDAESKAPVPSLSTGLKQNNELCRALVARTPNAIILSDLDGRIVETNPAACELLGYSSEELCSLSVGDVETGVSNDRVEERWVRLASGTPLVLESVYRKKNGVSLPVELRMRFIEAGQHRYVFCVAADITSRRWMEEQSRLRLELEKAIAEVSRLFGRPDELELDEVLSVVGRAVSASRALLVEFGSGEEPDDHRVYTWNNVSTEAALTPPSPMNRTSIPWLWEQLQASENIVVSDTAGMPEAAAGERAFVEAQGTRAFVVVPVQTPQGRLVGMLVVDDSMRRREWFDETVQALRAAAEMVGSHWERRHTEEALRASEERFRRLVEHSGDAFLLLNRHGRVVDANQRACDNLGYKRDELLELQMSEVDAAMVHARIGFLWQRITPGQPVTLEASHRRKDGTTYPAEVRLGVLESHDREYMLCLVRDLTEQQRVESELRSSNEQLKSWVEELEHRSREMSQINELGELLQVCQSPAEAYHVISRSARRLFPGDAGAVYVLDNSRSVLEAVAAWGAEEPPERVFGPDDCWALRRGRLHVETRREGGLVCPHVTGPPNGGYLCMPMVGQGETMGLLHLRFLDHEGGDNGVGRHLRGAKERLAVTIADQISLALANLNLRETLRTQAIRDPLTGLFNRRYMEESLERELHRAARKGVPLGIIMLDIDHFKRVNDNLGHAAGDAVLREFGSFLRSQVRGEDIACRYGGEEFVLILLDSTLEHTVDRANGMRESLADLNFQTRQEGLGPITASLGVAAVPEHGATKQTLMGAADGALYTAKREGRDRVCVAQFKR